MSARLTERLPDWFDNGNCRDVGLELAVVFLYAESGRNANDPNKHTPQRTAKQICEGCPILMPCREWGKNMPGVYGGMTLGERQEYFYGQKEGAA